MDAFILPWHTYVVIVVSTLIGNILFVLARRSESFEDRSRFGKFFIRFACFSGSMMLFAVPYMAWLFTSFGPVHAREAERMMIEQFQSQGATNVQTRFIVTGHSSLSGIANVTLADGTSISVQCRAEKAWFGSEFLVFCE